MNSKNQSMIKQGGVLALALVTNLVAASAFAETTPAASSTSANATAVAPSLREKLSASYLGILAGPSLAHPTTPFQPNKYGDISRKDSNKIGLANQVSLGYKAAPELSFSALIGFDYNMIAGQSVTFRDPALRVSKANVINNNGLTLAADFRVVPGITPGSQEADMLVAFRTTQSLEYQIPASRFKLGTSTFATTYLYGDSEMKEGHRMLRLYFYPNVSYDISDKVSASLAYEGDYQYDRETGWGQLSDSAIYLGAAFQATPSINVNPFVAIFPEGKINADATQLGLILSAKLL